MPDTMESNVSTAAPPQDQPMTAQEQLRLARVALFAELRQQPALLRSGGLVSPAKIFNGTHPDIAERCAALGLGDIKKLRNWLTWMGRSESGRVTLDKAGVPLRETRGVERQHWPKETYRLTMDLMRKHRDRNGKLDLEGMSAANPEWRKLARVPDGVSPRAVPGVLAFLSRARERLREMELQGGGGANLMPALALAA